MSRETAYVNADARKMGRNQNDAKMFAKLKLLFIGNRKVKDLIV